MIIACDVGGVLKNLTSDEPIKDSLESFAQIILHHEIILISKCGINYQKKNFKLAKEIQLG
jgi:hypothetical protein